MSMKDIRNLPAVVSLVEEIEERRDVYQAITGESKSIRKIFHAQGGLEACKVILDLINKDPAEEEESE